MKLRKNVYKYIRKFRKRISRNKENCLLRNRETYIMKQRKIFNEIVKTYITKLRTCITKDYGVYMDMYVVMIASDNLLDQHVANE